MGEQPESWELDEIHTLKAMLRLYKAQFETHRQTNRALYITREEYTRITGRLLDCFDRSLTQIDRMADCIGTLGDTVQQLIAEIGNLKERMDEES